MNMQVAEEILNEQFKAWERSVEQKSERKKRQTGDNSFKLFQKVLCKVLIQIVNIFTIKISMD